MSLYILSRDFSEYKESKESTENLIEDTIEQESNNVDEINIDWEKLMKINEDIVGWIKINDTNISILDAMITVGFAPSKGQARTLIVQGGISLNDEKITDVTYMLSDANFENGYAILKKGKKVFHKLEK